MNPVVFVVDEEVKLQYDALFGKTFWLSWITNKSESPRTRVPYTGTAHFRHVPEPVPTNSFNFQSVPPGFDHILATEFRRIPGRTSPGEIPVKSASEVAETRPLKTVPKSGSMEILETPLIRPILIGTGRNYPTKPARNPIEGTERVPAILGRVTSTWVILPRKALFT